MDTDPLSFNLPDLIMRLMTWQWDLESSYSDFPRLFQELAPGQLQVYLSGPTPVELPGCSLGSTARQTPMKALLWTTDFHFYARIRWLAETLDAAVDSDDQTFHLPQLHYYAMVPLTEYLLSADLRDAPAHIRGSDLCIL